MTNGQPIAADGDEPHGEVGFLDLFAQGAPEATLIFPDRDEQIALGALWNQVERRARWLQCRPGETVAALLDPSPACLAFALGTLLAGKRLVSLPLPSPTQAVDAYTGLLISVIEDQRVGTIGVDRSLISLIEPFGFEAIAFDDPFAVPATPFERGREGSLIQFTSGSTGNPLPRALTVSQVTRNLEAIAGHLDLRPGDRCCSWLPLSHDMGFVGMVLTALASAAPDRAGGSGQLILHRPETFLRDPLSWLRSCSSHGATITGAPPFGLDLVRRRLESDRPTDLDLSTLRCVIIGADVIDADLLAAFAHVAQLHGLTPDALCPSYGMAEVGVAVSMSPVGQGWRTVASPDPDVPMAAVGDSSRVSCGQALAGYEIQIDDADPSGLGEIVVSGPSLAAPFHTRDLGFLDGNELVVVGRLEGFCKVQGRKVFTADVDRAVRLANPPGARRWGCVVTDRNTLGVLVELNNDSVDPVEICREVRVAVVEQLGVALDVVTTVDRGAFPRTSSGKVRHDAARKVLAAASPAD